MKISMLAMSLGGALGAIALSALDAAPAQAAVVVGTFKAVVTSNPNPGAWNGASVGDQITGSFRYDTTYLPPNTPSCAAAGRGCYFAADPAHSFLSISMTLDGVTYDFADDQSTTLDIGDYIQTLPGHTFDQFTVGAVGAATVSGATGHTGSAFVQVFPYRRIFTSADPTQTFAVTSADLHGSSADTASLDGIVLGFSTIRMSDRLAAAAAPEPAGWAMLLIGLGLIGGALRNGRQPGRAALPES